MDRIVHIRERQVAVGIDDKAGRRIRGARVRVRLAERRDEFRVIPDRDLQHVADAELVSRRRAEQRGERIGTVGRLLRAHLAHERQVDRRDRNVHFRGRIAGVVAGFDERRGRLHAHARCQAATGEERAERGSRSESAEPEGRHAAIRCRATWYLFVFE